MTEHEKQILDNTLELVGQHEARITALEAAPPGQWAQSVAFLVDRYVTRRNVLWTAGTVGSALAVFYAAFNGVPV